MKTVWTIAGAMVVLLLVGLIPVLSQDDDEMEAWKKMAEPDENHKLLAKYAGNWDLDMSLWFVQDQPPVKHKSKDKIEIAHGGRFWHETWEMKDGPLPSTGDIWIGCDKASKKFQSMMFSSMGLGMTLFEGTYDEKSKKLTMSAKYTLGGRETTQRNIYHFESDDKFTYTVMTHYAGVPDMPEEGIKEIEIVYTRAK
jgi:hypothetical protein